MYMHGTNTLENCHATDKTIGYLSDDRSSLIMHTDHSVKHISFLKAKKEFV